MQHFHSLLCFYGGSYSFGESPFKGGSRRLNRMKRLNVLEKENIRLKRLVAEKELDIQILRETLAFESKTVYRQNILDTFS